MEASWGCPQADCPDRHFVPRPAAEAEAEAEAEGAFPRPAGCWAMAQRRVGVEGARVGEPSAPPGPARHTSLFGGPELRSFSQSTSALL